MKRGAEALEREEPTRHRSDSRNWKKPKHKRMRHGDQDQSRYGNADNKGGRADADAKVKTLADKKETDPHRLAQRQKQIDYGKNTIGYDRYCAQVPRHQRRSYHPKTPDKTKSVGKKVFDGMVRKWRQALHKYDPPELTEALKTVEMENAVVEDASKEAASDAKDSTSLASTTDSDVKTDAGLSTAPAHSIYENFYEDNLDQEDSDDDLL
ncbi:hypothetical protein PHMEG_0006067 [Phytophthora megakarya]|uniref:Histone RNA hairpin-binding protein RNA-binding domain-containing protein n=1 Tax=Phytophthora megakarya TaxID=4795 RepID=A0A225WRR9_9STRA|nr:hypothetical protein PHMEG_0006067 [Phytophthora megakarya]